MHKDYKKEKEQSGGEREEGGERRREGRSGESRAEQDHDRAMKKGY